MLYEEHNSSHRWVHAPGTVLWPMMCNFSLSFYGDLPANTNCRTENRQFAGIIYPERGRGGVWALVHLLLSMFWEPLHSGLSTGEHRGFNLGSQMHVRQDTKPWCCCHLWACLHPRERVCSFMPCGSSQSPSRALSAEQWLFRWTFLAVRWLLVQT